MGLGRMGRSGKVCPLGEVEACHPTIRGYAGCDEAAPNLQGRTLCIFKSCVFSKRQGLTTVVSIRIYT